MIFGQPPYDHKYSTNSTGDFTELFDRKLGTASRLAGTWTLDAMIHWVQMQRRDDRGKKGK